MMFDKLVCGLAMLIGVWMVGYMTIGTTGITNIFITLFGLAFGITGAVGFAYISINEAKGVL